MQNIQKPDVSSTADLQREVAEMMIECLNLEVTADQIAPDAPLYGDGLGLDSIDVLEVALVVSKRYGLQLRSDSARQPAHFQLAAQPHRLYRSTENPLMAHRIVRLRDIAALVIGYPLLRLALMNPRTTATWAR